MGKRFIILGNGNAINYLCPLFKESKMWLGPSITGGGRWFRVPKHYPLMACDYRVDESGNKFIRVMGVRWFTNLEHGKRPQAMSLSKLWSRDATEYPHYDNYDAIEVSKTRDIPEGYNGIMGVPLTFLDKYCPEQFEIIGITYSSDRNPDIEKIRTSAKHRHNPIINGKEVYPRILIRFR